jgi:sialic acid synthase SpsE
MDTFVIAEAGSNHNGIFDQALKLIDVAYDAGASAVKFQTFKSETLYNKNTPNFAGYNNINDLIKSLELPRDWQKPLKEYCDKKNIEFMSSPFDEQAVQDLVDLDVKRIKIAGFESTDLRFVEMVASTKLPLIISAGIGCSLDFIYKIIKICNKSGCDDVTILHCNNAYPTPQKDINLNTIKDIKSWYPNVKVGLSDHTTNTLTPSLAVALGATTIEKHITISKQLPGPDHIFALEPHELKEMISMIQLTELSLGRKKGQYTTSEQLFKKAGRSIVAKKNISQGDRLTVDNITTMRPYLDNSVQASLWFEYLNSTAEKNYKVGDFI